MCLSFYGIFPFYRDIVVIFIQIQSIISISNNVREQNSSSLFGWYLDQPHFTNHLNYQISWFYFESTHYRQEDVYNTYVNTFSFVGKSVICSAPVLYTNRVKWLLNFCRGMTKTNIHISSAYHIRWGLT